jgi:hypothetical protein
MRINGEMQGGAEWGPPGDATSEWRFRLWRAWGAGPRVAFIGLNPSTATETKNDPTIRRCIGFAMAWGFDGLEMLNIFGLRSTDPAGLYRHRNPHGVGNTDAIVAVTANCRLIICAWGSHGKYMHQGIQVVRSLVGLGRDLSALRINGDGTPGHPLYLRADTKPIPYAPGIP